MQLEPTNISLLQTKSIYLRDMSVEKKWVLKENADQGIVSQLSSELGVDSVLAELLVQRGVTTFNQARSFFRPDLNNLYDPFLMKDMDKAVERLHKAISSRERMLYRLRRDGGRAGQCSLWCQSCSG